MTTEQIFTEQFRSVDKGEHAPVAWDGSTVEQTGQIVEQLPALLTTFGISTVLDLGCGDFHWMNRVVSDELTYIGADIVVPLLERNRRKYAEKNVDFRRIDALSDAIPQVDLILCRDLLVHLSYRDAFLALRNMCASKSRYLLANTYTARSGNQDVPTGDWRVLNLERAPFSFPPPLRTLVEGCTELNGANADKSLCLWLLADIAKCVP